MTRPQPPVDFPLDNIYRATADGRTRAAVDLVFDWFDQALDAGRTEDIAHAIMSIDADRLSPTVALALETAASWGGLSVSPKTRMMAAKAQVAEP